jgi:hypothetical protein
MKTKKCKGCGERYEKQPDYPPFRNWCSIDCAVSISQDAQERAREKKEAKAKREYNKETKLLREKIRKRTGKGGYYESLKTALHYYVKHVLRKGEPCYTCDKPQSFSDSGGAFHVGHYMPAGTVDPRRFMLENLRIQCFSCNAAKSGNQAEYRKRLAEEMGIDHVKWLECIVNHKSLGEQYPTVESIQEEARRYRRLAKEKGL